MAYTIFESTNMGTTKYDGKIFDAVAATDIENGTFGYIDGLLEGSDTIYVFKAGTKEGEAVFVVDNPAWDSNTSLIANQRRDNYINKAGVPFRIREVNKNDKFGVSIDGFTAATQETADKGAFVTIDSTTGKLVASDSKSGGATFEGEIEGKRVSGGKLVTAAQTYGRSGVIYKIRVIKYTDVASQDNGTSQSTDPQYTYTEVANPTGNPSTSGYFEEDGSGYVASTDTEVDETKTYYTRSISE